MHQKGHPSDARTAYRLSSACSKPWAGIVEPRRAEPTRPAGRPHPARQARGAPDDRDSPRGIPRAVEREVAIVEASAFAEQHGEGEFGAATMMLSTVVSFATLTAWMFALTAVGWL